MAQNVVEDVGVGPEAVGQTGSILSEPYSPWKHIGDPIVRHCLGKALLVVYPDCLR